MNRRKPRVKKVNGYAIRYNRFWGMYQCKYDGAIYAEFSSIPEAIEYCEKG